MIYELLKNVPSGRMSKSDIQAMLGLNSRALRRQKEVELLEQHLPVGSSSNFSGYFLLTTIDQFNANIAELRSRINSLKAQEQELIAQRDILITTNKIEQLTLDFGE